MKTIQYFTSVKNVLTSKPSEWQLSKMTSINLNIASQILPVPAIVVSDR